MSKFTPNNAQDAAKMFAEKAKFGGGDTPAAETPEVQEPETKEPQEPEAPEVVTQTQEPEVVDTPPAQSAEEPAPAEPTPPAEPVANWEEKSKSYEAEIEALKGQLAEKPSFEFANDEIKKLDELAKGGVTIDQHFWEMQSLDLGKYDTSSTSDALKLVRLELKVNNKDYSDEEIEFLIERNYPELFDDSYDKDDDEYKRSAMSLRIDAKGAKTKLAEYKDKIALPTRDIHAEEKAKEAERAQTEAFLKEVRQNVQSYDKQTFRAGDIELDFLIDNDARQTVESSIVNGFFESYIKDDKTIDYGKLKRDLILISNQDKILKMIYDQGASSGEEKVADVLENATTEPSSQNVDTHKSYADQIREHFEAKGGPPIIR